MYRGLQVMKWLKDLHNLKCPFNVKQVDLSQSNVNLGPTTASGICIGNLPHAVKERSIRIN